jgi:WD40 repeat protein
MRDEDRLAQLVQDAWRFIMYHKGAIEGYPLQTYASALLFSPTGSLIRQLFQHEEPEAISIRPALSDRWSACLQTLKGRSDYVNSVAFSHDSMRLASASHNRTVRIWDASSGACLQTLEGHSSYVSSVAFSHDSMRLASASHDRTIRIWEASSGACLQTLEGHSSQVNSVAFSHDSMRLASASHDRTVRIWDASSGACLQTLEGHSGYVSSADPVSILALPHFDEIVSRPNQLVRQGIAISLDNIWVSDKNQKLLWLPTEYRPVSSAISGRCVGLGGGSGRFLICRVL